MKLLRKAELEIVMQQYRPGVHIYSDHGGNDLIIEVVVLIFIIVIKTEIPLLISIDNCTLLLVLYLNLNIHDRTGVLPHFPLFCVSFIHLKRLTR